jgi:hypothetical protein
MWWEATVVYLVLMWWDLRMSACFSFGEEEFPVFYILFYNKNDSEVDTHFFQ